MYTGSSLEVFLVAAIIITLPFIESYSIDEKNETNVIIHCHSIKSNWKCSVGVTLLKLKWLNYLKIDLLSTLYFYLTQLFIGQALFKSLSQFNSVKKKKTENPPISSSSLLLDEFIILLWKLWWFPRGVGRTLELSVIRLRQTQKTL